MSLLILAISGPCVTAQWYLQLHHGKTSLVRGLYQKLVHAFSEFIEPRRIAPRNEGMEEEGRGDH